MAKERKTIPRWAVKFSSFLYLVASIMVILGVNSVKYKLLIWLGIAVFVAGFILRIVLCSCPYCGSATASKAAKLNGESFFCPNCEEKIDQR